VKTNKSIVFALVAAFVFGMAMTAGAATIQAVKVKGAIPNDPQNLFWSERYGPTALKHVIIDMDPQMTVKSAHDIAETVKQRIFKQFPAVGDVMIHINPHDEAHVDMVRL